MRRGIPVYVTGADALGVVIATRNRRASLLRTVQHLVELPERPRLVVVDNASTDDSAGAVRSAFPGVTVVPLPANVGAAARTVGALALATPLVAFSDDDSWWSPGSLERAAELFAARRSLGLVAGRILVGPDQRPDPTCAQMAASPLPRHPGQPGSAILGFVACAAVVRREAFLHAGGFHPRVGVGGEETLLALDLASLGWELSYVDDVVAHHDPPSATPRPAREATVLRNRLWAAWLRRPAFAAAAETARAVAAAPAPAAARGLAEAARGLPWIRRSRRVVPPEVERDVRRLRAARAA
jgi:GT2 family glycosyltransferase